MRQGDFISCSAFKRKFRTGFRLPNIETRLQAEGEQACACVFKTNVTNLLLVA